MHQPRSENMIYRYSSKLSLFIDNLLSGLRTAYDKMRLAHLFAINLREIN